MFIFFFILFGSHVHVCPYVNNGLRWKLRHPDEFMNSSLYFPSQFRCIKCILCWFTVQIGIWTHVNNRNCNWPIKVVGFRMHNETEKRSSERTIARAHAHAHNEVHLIRVAICVRSEHSSGAHVCFMVCILPMQQKKLEFVFFSHCTAKLWNRKLDNAPRARLRYCAKEWKQKHKSKTEKILSVNLSSHSAGIVVNAVSTIAGSKSRCSSTFPRSELIPFSRLTAFVVIIVVVVFVCVCTFFHS